ncbi:MAG: hypothetical protein JWP35_3483 [Caulobacter sp.]|nr:hypothetical protein [Caulobacter sp.]
MRRVLILVSMAFFLAGAAWAQEYATGQSVYASPSGAVNDWYSGCIVGAGRSNSSYQVECAGETYWISSDHIRTSPPQPAPDPMRPGQMLTPTITPSHATAGGGATNAGGGGGKGVAPANGERTYEQINGGVGPGSYARQGAAKAPPGSLKTGPYGCYVGNVFAMNMALTSATTYRDSAGQTGTYRYAGGRLVFLSGSLAGHPTDVFGDGSFAISEPGRTSFGTQCSPGG